VYGTMKNGIHHTIAETFQCPKCGLPQDRDSECPGCGVIFEKIHPVTDTPVAEAPIPETIAPSEQPETKHNFHYFRMVRRALLLLTLVALGLVLHNSPPPDVKTTPQDAQQAQNRFNEFLLTVRSGGEGTLEMNQSELNGWLDTNLAYRNSHESESADTPGPATNEDTAGTTQEGNGGDDAEIEKAMSTVRDIRIQLFEDTLLAYVVFDAHGIDLSLELEGRLQVEDGYLRLDPVRAKLGSLPLSEGMMRRATSKLFDSPENREKFRIPPYIRDIRITGGRLMVSSLETQTAP
jgi:hypothetical protein